MIRIQILKTIDPGQYLYRQVPSTHMSDEVKQFEDMVSLMNQTYSDDSIVSLRPSEPTPGMVCIGRNPSDKIWYRVKIVCITQTPRGPHASCSLLDYGKDHVLIPLSKLREPVNEFFTIPYQAKTCFLFGIKPVAMRTNPETLEVKKMKCSTWDGSATVFMNTLFKDCHCPKLKIVKEDSSSKSVYAMLYLDDPASVEGSVCVNERLVEEGFALWDLDQSPARKYGNKRRWKITSPALSVSSSSDRETEILSGSITDEDADSISSPPWLQDAISKTGMGRGKLLGSILSKPASQTQGLSPLSKLIALSESKQMNLDSPSSHDTLHQSQQSDTERNRHSSSDTAVSRTPRGCVSDTEGLASLTRGIVLSTSGPTKQRLPHFCLNKLKKRQPVSANTSPIEDQCTADNGCTPSRNIKSILRKSPSTDSHRRSLNVQIAEGCEVRECSPVRNGYPFSRDGDTVHQPQQLAGSAVEAGLGMLMMNPNTTSSHKGPHGELVPVNIRVLVKGVSKPKAIVKVEETPFADIARRIPTLGRSITPTKLQRCAWPAFLRGRNVVGVGTSRKTMKTGGGGKTLAYLIPLLYHLQQREHYDDVPTSNGPIALVLCPSWKTAWHVSEECKQLLGRVSSVRVQLMYGGSNEEAKEVELINGCEVLISTPPSLLRMMEKGVATFKRLRHAMLEDAHLLLDKCHDQVEEVMSKCDMGEVKLGVFTSEWNPHLTQFVKKWVSKPVVVLAAAYDAAVYGGLKQIPICCKTDQRLQQLWGVVDSTAYKETKSTVVCCCDPEQAKIVYQYLRGQSIYVLNASDPMSGELGHISEEWNLNHRPDSQPIMVVSDDALPELNITNANLVVHFEIPKKAETLARRLWCMRDNFHDCIYESESSDGVAPLSYLMITEQCAGQAAMLVRMLHRCQVPPPDFLLSLKQQHQLVVEQGQHSQLCPQIKAFGKCSNENRCNKRHMIFDSLDGSDVASKIVSIPLQGRVKILVTYVENATCLFARLLEEQGVDGVVKPGSMEYPRLIMDMGLFLGNAANKIPLPYVEVGQICAWEDIQHSHHRVEVLELSAKIDDRGIPLQAHVRLIDTGGERQVHCLELYPLPDRLQQVAHQAVEVVVCRIKPVDLDEEWTHVASMHVADCVQNKTLTGKIVLSLGRTLWLDPLYEEHSLSSIGSTTATDIRASLLESGLALENPEHLHLLYGACSGRLDLPVSLLPEENPCRAYTSRGMLTSIFHQTLQVGQDKLPVAVHLTGIYSPDWFYVRLAQDEERLRNLTSDIANHIRLSDKPEHFKPRSKLLVIALCPDDDRWHRGKVDEVLEDGSCEVFFVDVGITEVVEADKLRPMPCLFQQDPPSFMAIECGLMGLEPAEGGEWSVADADCLWDITRQANGVDGKTLYATVMNQSQARVAGSQVYGISLTDTTREYDVNVAHKMVSLGNAQLSSHQIQELCLSTSQSQYEICQLCAHLIKSKGKTEQSHLSTDILAKCYQCSVSVDVLESDRVLRCLCVTLELVQHPSVVKSLVISIVKLIKGGVDMDLKEMLIGTLCQLLDKGTMGAATSTIVWCFNEFSSDKR